MITDRFDQSATKAPERVFIRTGDSTFTYREAFEMSHAIAAGLIADGLSNGAGRHVGLLAPNDPLALVALLGVVRSGTPYVPLATSDADPALAGFMRTADVEVLICHPSQAGRVEALRALCPGLRAVVGFEAPLEPGGACLAGWCDSHVGARVERRPAPADIALIKASGGTTGAPKAIVQTHGALEVAYRTLNRYARPETDDPVHLVVAPLTHAAGASTLAFAEFGTTNVLAHTRDPGSILAQMEADRVSHVFLPPTVIYRLLTHEDAATRDLSALECVVYGAAPMSADKLALGLRLWGPVFLQAYGQSEAPGLVSVLARRDHLIPEGADDSPLRSAGRPTGACEVALMDDEGRIVPVGEAGEVVLKGDLVTPGYWRNEAANDEAHRFGWHHTGDVGRFDRDGFLYIVDRKKDMIISGGFNVYPSEVEQVIWGLEAVQDCAVVGVRDDDWGEVVTAVVELKPGATTDEAAIIAACRAALGPVKSPKKVMFWESLPRSAVGKVLKKDIRARLNEAGR